MMRFAGGSSNGRTADSDSVSLGSNPSPPANLFLAQQGFSEEAPTKPAQPAQAERAQNRTQQVSDPFCLGMTDPVAHHPANVTLFRFLNRGGRTVRMCRYPEAPGLHITVTGNGRTLKGCYPDSMEPAKMAWDIE